MRRRRNPSRKSQTTWLLLGGAALALYLLWDKLGLGSLPSAGTAASGAAASLNQTAALSNPTLAPIGLTSAQSAGSTSLTANVGATQPFTITGLT